MSTLGSEGWGFFFELLSCLFFPEYVLLLSPKLPLVILRSGLYFGFIFFSCRVVEFASYSDLKNAIEKLSGKEINGRKIKLIEGSKRHRYRFLFS